MTHALLLEQMKRLGLTEMEVMDLLTEARIISDNCIRLWDIAGPDLTKAVQWLMVKRIKWGDGTDCNRKVLV